MTNINSKEFKEELVSRICDQFGKDGINMSVWGATIIIPELESIVKGCKAIHFNGCDKSVVKNVSLQFIHMYKELQPTDEYKTLTTYNKMNIVERAMVAELFDKLIPSSKQWMNGFYYHSMTSKTEQA